MGKNKNRKRKKSVPGVPSSTSREVTFTREKL